MNWKNVTFTALVWSLGALAASAQVEIPMDLPTGLDSQSSQSSVQYEQSAPANQSASYSQPSQYGQATQYSQSVSYERPVQYVPTMQFSQATRQYSQPQFLQNMQYVQHQYPQMMQYHQTSTPQFMQYGQASAPQYNQQVSQAQPPYQQPQYNQQYNQQYQQPAQYQQQPANQQYQQPQQYQDQPQVQSQPSGWSVVGVPGVFSAAMPGKSTSTDTSMNDTTATHWSADMGDPMHMFAIEMQSCGPVSGGNMDNLLFSLMNARSKTVGAEPSRRRRLENQTSPGCMFDIVTGDTEWNYMIRVVGTNVITMSVCSMPGQGNDQYVQQFFNSFVVR